MNLGLIAQIAINGLMLGGIYALIAFGLSVIYGVSKVLNLTHGTLLTLAGVLACYLFSSYGLHPLWIFVILTLVFFPLGGIFWRCLIAPISSKPPMEFGIASVLVTVGTMLLIEDTTLFFAGSSLFSIPFDFPVLHLGNLLFSSQRLWILVLIIVVWISLHLFLTRTYAGRAIRSVTQDRKGALLVGVNLTRVNLITFGIGFSLISIAAIFYAMVFSVGPYMGFGLTVKAFTVIILGGIGSLTGSLAGGIILGMAEVITSFIFEPKWAPAFSVIILLAALAIKPEGLFGKR